MALNGTNIVPSRRLLARIRCLSECVDKFKAQEPLPRSLCYVPLKIEYKSLKNSKIIAYDTPKNDRKKTSELKISTNDILVVTGEQYSNSVGQWGHLVEIQSTKSPNSPVLESCWVLLFNANKDEGENFVLKDESPKKYSTTHTIHSWLEVIEHEYAIHTRKETPEITICPYHEEGTEQLQSLVPNWNLEHDEDLAQFLCSHIELHNDMLGSIKNYVESIDVSSSSEEDGPDNLTDGDPETFWESDGNQGMHWIRLKMKKGTIIKKLSVLIDGGDDNYMPTSIYIYGGDLDNLKKLNYVSIETSLCGLSDTVLLEDQIDHHPVLEIRLKECKDDGIDTRIHGIKITSTKERDLGLNRDLFSSENLVRYPKLENVDRDALYRRALVLQRFITLLDSVLPFIVPAWEFSIGSYRTLEVVRQLLPMSQKRISMIDTFLRESESSRPSRMPKLYINRRAAAEHKLDPNHDPECKNTVFHQIYDGLKPRDRCGEKAVDYRWPSRYDQWWECKFLAEGIIDQGGGFRDSLSDLADELCPNAQDVPVPLPHFVRAPNQSNADLNVNRDVYVPNPSCELFHQYEWIGKLMGACLRGKESLVLCLPAFIWKKLSGERVSWNRDFITVDESIVKLMENMDNMDEETFLAYFGEERSWTTVLSDGSTVDLQLDGLEKTVMYSERHQYAQLVAEVRMAEADKQITSIRKGLLSVVPQAVLDLLTWQELERRICGDPEIPLSALRHTARYEDLDEKDVRAQHLWQALTNFSNEDRSRFLRFVTGRRRLPAPLYICPDKGDSIDALPESSTCSNTLYLPTYSSAKICEEKLRYAAYNCIAIDTDMSPWDD